MGRAKRALKNWVMVALAAASFVAIFAFQVPFPLIILAAGIIGYVGTRIAPGIFKAGGHGAGKVIAGRFLELREPEAQRGRGSPRTVRPRGGASLCFGLRCGVD